MGKNMLNNVLCIKKKTETHHEKVIPDVTGQKKFFL